MTRIVVFRELNNKSTWALNIPLLKNKNAKVTVLGGKGTATYQDGKLKVEIPDTLQYLFLRVASE